MLTVLSIIGTRPEAIKMTAIIIELERHPDRIVSRVCATGKHREVLDQVLRLSGIRRSSASSGHRGMQSGWCRRRCVLRATREAA